MRHGRGILALTVAALLLLAGVAAEAATIEVERSGGRALVLVEGDLELNDGQRFSEKVEGLTDAIVAFSSPGGSLHAGLRIGEVARLKNFRTLVPDDALCASACALAWLGGAKRYMGERARIGFHAAYKMERGRAKEVGVGNAIAGAYLNRLGLSDLAIIFVTSAPPDDLNWLTPERAREVGIKVAVLRLDEPPRPRRSPKSRPAVPAALPPAPAAEPPKPRTVEETARRFASTYFAHWAEANGEALRYFASVYAPTISLAGRPIARERVLEGKRKFAEAWPHRLYAADPTTFAVSCEGASKCTVEGEVEWNCRAPERGEETHGTARFTLQLRMLPSGGARIEGEWSTVVAQH